MQYEKKDDCQVAISVLCRIFMDVFQTGNIHCQIINATNVQVEEIFSMPV